MAVKLYVLKGNGLKLYIGYHKFRILVKFHIWCIMTA